MDHGHPPKRLKINSLFTDESDFDKSDEGETFDSNAITFILKGHGLIIAHDRTVPEEGLKAWQGAAIVAGGKSNIESDRLLSQTSRQRSKDHRPKVISWLLSCPNIFKLHQNQRGSHGRLIHPLLGRPSILLELWRSLLRRDCSFPPPSSHRAS